MIFWICTLLTISSALVATFWSDLRVAILALWLAGLGAGGLFLSMGAELLAVTQWILSTLAAISFLFYAITFGEYGRDDHRPKSKKLLSAFVASLLGAGFAAVIWLGIRHIPGAGAIQVSLPAQLEKTSAMGIALIRDHLLSIEILAVTLFLALIGGGVIARAEVDDA